jgi:hypothetical protein
MKGNHKRQHKQDHAKPVVVSSEADEPAQEQETAKAPKADSKSKWWKLGRNKYVYKPPDSMLSILGFLVGILVLIVYFLQWQAMKQSMQVDERAWLSIKEQNGVSPVQLDQVPQVTMILANTGKTPARDIRLNFYIEVVPENGNPQFENRTIKHTSSFTGIIMPNSHDEIPVERYKPEVDPKTGYPVSAPITAEEWKQLTEGQSWIAVHGVVFYNDIFHTPHWVKFCAWKGLRQVDYSAAKCTLYNGVDENK